MKKKLAFVSVRYGLNINGGAELHCRMLAERLKPEYDIDILTTCVVDYISGENSLDEGIEEINGITVRRFRTNGCNSAKESLFLKKVNPVRRFRMFLHRIGILRYVSCFVKTWKWRLQDDKEAQKYDTFYSDGLISYIAGHKNDYDAFIIFSSNFSLFYFAAMAAGEKTLAIPLLHYMKTSFRPYLTQAFSEVRHICFNTPAEFHLAESIFGPLKAKSSVVGVGIEVVEPASWDLTQKQFGLPDRYILFIGRVDRDKTGDMLSYYSEYKELCKDKALPLVVIGNVYEKDAIDKNVISTGFISDNQKRAILQHATVLLNPSKYESLSLVLLEALYDCVPTLVNGHCNVFRDHNKRSKGAVAIYRNKRDFINKLVQISTDAGLRNYMKTEGKKYMTANYDWDIIIAKLQTAIETVCNCNCRQNTNC